MRSFLALLLLLIPAPLLAQSLNCTAPGTQAELTGCAAQAHAASDAFLNQAWRKAMDAARAQDAYLRAGDVPSAQMLRDAQRAWITYRDQACDAESTIARGGSMQNMLVYICLERLTRRRTEDLRLFAEQK